MKKQLNILVVDDDRVTRIAMDRLIEVLGHQVSLATNGVEAIDAMSEADFDIVLMDLSMPIMDGIEASRAIRDGDAGAVAKTTPILALTASGDECVIRDAMSAGIDGYLFKPIDIQILEEKVLEMVG